MRQKMEKDKNLFFEEEVQLQKSVCIGIQWSFSAPIRIASVILLNSVACQNLQSQNLLSHKSLCQIFLDENFPI